MSTLVFLEPNKIDAVPFTTSDVIAQWTQNGYRSIQRTIERQITRLEKFGRVRFEITPLQTKGGVQDHKVYHLNEEQATLLITFLKNTDTVADFKVELRVHTPAQMRPAALQAPGLELDAGAYLTKGEEYASNQQGRFGFHPRKASGLASR